VVSNVAKPPVKPLRAALPQGKKPSNPREKDTFELIHEFLEVVMANSAEVIF
jgi:hypothetical protein